MGFFRLCLLGFLAFNWSWTTLVAQDDEDAGNTDEEQAEEVAGQLEKPEDILKFFTSFKAEARTPVLEDNGYYPCTDCHDGEDQMPNPKVRVLEEDHEDVVLNHGRGRFWCLACHDENDRDALRSKSGAPISFDASYLLCGECHYQEQRDFFNGAHGKRLENWNGERILRPCTGCHGAHDPQIKPREPVARPNPRKGLPLPHEDKVHARAGRFPWEEGHHD